MCEQTSPKWAYLLGLIFHILLHFVHEDCLHNKQYVSKKFIIQVRLEEGFHKGDFLSLSPKHFVFVLLFFYSDAHIASHYLFDAHQKDSG